MIHGHGGNVREAAAVAGCCPEDIIDMSSNINPLGPPPGLLDHLRNRMADACALPQVDAGQAVDAYAGWQGIAEKRVLAGAGTTQFLYQMPSALGISSALVVSPTYADYGDALAMHGVSFSHFMLKEEDGFAPDMNALAEASGSVDTVFFCNPNNPTGHYTSTDAIQHLVTACPGTRFVIDESYLPFVDRHGNDSIAYRNLPNVIVLQSLSKMFCIPGLRVGFCLAPEETAERIAAYSPPWAVNALAQEAVLYITANPDEAAAHAARTRQYLVDERAAFMKCLDNPDNLTVYSGAATFILARASGFTASELVHHLLGNRLLIRNCSNFKGLSEQFFRVSLKQPDENRQAAELIRDFARQHAVDSAKRGT